MGCWSQSVEFPGPSQPVRGLQGGLSQLPIHKTFWPLTRVVTSELLIINNLFASLLNGAFITESHMDFSAMPPIPRTAALLKENSAYNGICQSQWPGTFHSLKIYLLFCFCFHFYLTYWKKKWISKYPILLQDRKSIFFPQCSGLLILHQMSKSFSHD